MLSCNKKDKYFYLSLTCNAVIATAPTISSALHPLDKSLTGFDKPCVIGPYASAFAKRSTIL